MLGRRTWWNGQSRGRPTRSTVVLAVGVICAIMLLPQGLGQPVEKLSAVQPTGASASTGSNATQVTSAAGSPGNRDCSIVVGSRPGFDAYDPVNHYVYVPNANSGNLSVLSGCTIVTTVTFPTGANPIAAAFDPSNNKVYVTDYGLEQVYVISGKALVHTITSSHFDEPWGVAYDPAAALMAVANCGSDTVTFISGTTITATTTVGSGPFSFAYDPARDRFLVTNIRSNNVTSFYARDPSDAHDNINIPVGSEPAGVAFDIANSYDYVANFASSNVTVISGVGAQIGSISVGSAPFGVVWDQAKLSVYVADSGSNTVSEIQGLRVVRNITGPSGANLYGIAYNEARDQVYVTGLLSGKVYVYDPLVAAAGSPGADEFQGMTAPDSSGTPVCSVNVGSGPQLDAYDPVNHYVYVPNLGSQNLSILNGCSIVATVTFPNVYGASVGPSAAAFNPTNNWVYVTAWATHGQGVVFVVSGTKLVKTLKNSTFVSPSAIAFDPGSALMVVANSGDDSITVISNTTVAGTATVGCPTSFAFDPARYRFLVTRCYPDGVTSMLARHPLNTTDYVNITVGSDPDSVAYDYANSYDYVTNMGGNNVSVISGLGEEIGSITVGYAPLWVVWDQAKLSMYVLNSSGYPSSSNIFVIQGLSVVGTIPLPSTAIFTAMAYDEASDQVFVTGGVNDNQVFVYT